MRVVFGSIITEGHGKVGGLIVQQSYGGFQMRRLQQPLKNPTLSQSVRRVGYAFVTKQWAQLSGSDRNTWNTAAPPGVSGFEFFCSYNLSIVNASGTIINAYSAPITNPPGLYAAVVNVQSFPGDLGLIVDFQKVPANNGIPADGWLPSFLWTGWIPGSRYSYPRMNRNLGFDVGGMFAGQYIISWANDSGINPSPPDVSYKCKFIERWINTTTGQIFTGSTYEVNGGDNYITGKDYDTGSFLDSTVSTGTPGDYTVVSNWIASGSTYDPTTWKPVFVMSDWFDPSGLPPDPWNNYIPIASFVFADDTHMTLTFSSLITDSVFPTVAGYETEVSFVWQNISTGELSFESTGVVTNDNS
ncbi:MAG TPA: hypothetical protein VGM38_10550 [Pseudolysinimonas sp.]